MIVLLSCYASELAETQASEIVAEIEELKRPNHIRKQKVLG